METGKIDQAEESMMRCRHRVAGWRPVAAIGVAGLTAGMMLAGGIGEAFVPARLASAGVTNSRPPALQREIVLATLTSVDVPSPPGNLPYRSQDGPSGAIPMTAARSASWAARSSYEVS
jgi:hypothetical protein